MFEINWNEFKTDKQIYKVNKLIERYFERELFSKESGDFFKKMAKIGFLWSDEINNWNNEEIDNLYKFTFNFFNENEIFSVPHGGTLLGFVRDGKSLMHDDDHDLSVDFHQLNNKFDIFEDMLKKNNFSFFWNKEIIKFGMSDKWWFWTKIISNRKVRVIIGDYYFEFNNSIDLFPIVYFDNFDEFLMIVEKYLLVYKSKNVDFSFYKSKIKERKKMLIDEYGKKNFEKIASLVESLSNSKMVSNKNTKDLLSEFNCLWFSKRSGKYYTTLTSKIIYKKWRETSEKPKIQETKNGLLYNSTSCDLDDVRLFYGSKWKKRPAYGPLHSINQYSFKGKINNK